ncbi:hypothetical protein MT371_24630 [Vibrio parahaemolyticus]|nr:hypothetical protein [Vibrio parahaemolyticus]EJG2373581.1 hypothetical protein [Vibrio parahaemolyticus]MDL2044749.1 hypothetical protein [Vibrio parahaemolyticus]
MNENSDIFSELLFLRNALESTPKSLFPSGTAFRACLTKFPTGCCGDTALLAAMHLFIKFGIECKYVSARGLGDNQQLSHAWIEYNGYIIDLSADQFNSKGFSLERVIFSKSSEFHGLFSKKEVKELNISALGTSPIGKSYSLIKNHFGHDLKALLHKK